VGVVEGVGVVAVEGMAGRGAQEGRVERLRSTAVGALGGRAEGAREGGWEGRVAVGEVEREVREEGKGVKGVAGVGEVVGSVADWAAWVAKVAASAPSAHTAQHC